MQLRGFLDRIWRLRRSRHTRALLVLASVAALSLIAATAEFIVLTKRERQLVDRFSDSTWWMASQFRSEIFQMHVSLASFDGSAEQLDDVQQHLDILYARIGVITEGDIEPKPDPEMRDAIKDVVAGVTRLGEKLEALHPVTVPDVRALSGQMRTLERSAGRMTTLGAQADAMHREAVREAIWRANIAFGLAAALLVGSLLLSLRAVERQATGLDLARRRSEALSEELTVALAQAQAGARAKTVFLATMSHEIRTPMNGVLGAASLLSHTPLGEDQRRWVEIVKACGEALLSQLDGVLDFSALETATMPLRPGNFDIRTLAEDTARVVEGAANQQGLDLVVLVDADVPPVLVGDRRRLGQVLLNLVTNAVKFTPAGGVLLRLSVRRREGQMWLRAAVVDTGPGIPRADRARIFQEFTRLDRSAERAVRGTGLGLAISLRIVMALGGSIRVASGRGGGSVFLATVPVDLPASATIDDGAGIDDGAPDRDGDEATGRGTAAVVGAVAPIRAGLLGLLRAEGYRPASPSADRVDVLLCPAATGETMPAFALPRAGRVVVFGLGTALDAPITAARLHAALAGLTLRRLQPATLPTPRLAGLPLSLLVVDDDPINCEIAASLLRHLGHRVATAADGHRALGMMRDMAFDCVLLDLHMPRMDGPDLARAIRALPLPTRAVRLVAVTADADAGIATGAIAAGIDAVLTKPVTLEMLQDALRPLVDVKRSPSPRAAMAASPIREALAARLSPDRLSALIGTFWEGVARALEQSGGFAEGDLERRMHTLSGSAASLGYSEVPVAARRVRNAAREGVAVADSMDLLYDVLATAARSDERLLSDQLAERLAAALDSERAREATEHLGGMA
jgi:signal transduction histidine kinase/DNA-binding response OmpR family regulator